jgi:hypothetical protein
MIRIIQLAKSILISVIALISASICIATPAHSQSRYTKSVEADFEDVFFDLQQAVIGMGLVVEHVGHVGKMLERTAATITGSTDNNLLSYKYAKYLQFCSSKLTHKATRLDPANLSMCPFILYAYETVKSPGQVIVGYRNPDFGVIKQTDPIGIEVHDLLKQLVDNTVADY